jgi:hypothetical protein
MISIYKASMASPALLREYVREAKALKRLPADLLEVLSVRYFCVKRGYQLDLPRNTLALILQGRAIETAVPVDGKAAQLAVHSTGDVIGWWPIDGYIAHPIQTHYIMIDVGGVASPELRELRAHMQERHLWAVRAQLALQMTTTVSERFRLDPPAPGEKPGEIARRLGCSREMVSRLLNHPTA